MPKVEQDVALQQRLNEYLDTKGISVAQAAKEFGLNRVSLWRFCGTGLARRDRRNEYAKALDRVKAGSETESVSVSVVKRSATPRLPLDERELQRIRKTCESVLNLLDAYQVSSSTAGGHR